MNQDVKGKGWKEKILETFHKSLSLLSTLTFHLKRQAWREGEAWQEGPFTHLHAVAFALWNRV